MSDVSEVASVRILLADYAASDAASKLNVIGGGVTVLGFVPAMNQTAPFTVVVTVSVPPSHYNHECALELVLEDALGNPVSLPGPTGEAQIMRVGQLIKFEEPKTQTGIPRGSLRSRHQWVLGFSIGLPLALGQRYIWRVKIDHETRDDWTEEFFLPGPNPGLVVG